MGIKIKIAWALVLLYVNSVPLLAQDKAYAREIIEKLSSKEMWGRGYTKGGQEKASNFLEGEFVRLGLSPLSEFGFHQRYSYEVNTFPGRMKVSINGKRLMPGRDYLVSPESRGAKGKVKLVKRDSTSFWEPHNSIILDLQEKLIWSVAPSSAGHTLIKLNKNSFHEIPQSIKVNIKQKHNPEFKTSNVVALVKGSVQPDSFLVITAHYDHLGGMGNRTYFPGANDNASGVALLLDLAKYYSQNRPPYSIAFVCFSGEEAGLLGSRYFVENPLIPLGNIRFLTNLDIAGTGEHGIGIVNALTFEKEFILLNQLNESHGYFSVIKKRGKAANSDHYWFSEKGVPSFFIYTMGETRAYHDIYDVSGTLSMHGYVKLFQLLLQFNDSLMN